MARYIGSVCRFCRREKLKLFLKGDRCYSEKCSVDRRPYPPGQHGQGRVKFSPYGVQLREKQKVKRIYGFLEKQFHITFDRANRMKGITGENLLQLLERRLDNIVYRMGFARSHREARQLVRHNHFLVNGKKANIPSMLVGVGNEIRVKDKSRKIALFTEAIEAVERRGIPGWIELDQKEMKATLKSYPTREDIAMPIQEQMIVELYSK